MTRPARITLIIIFVLLGILSFLPSAITIFGPEMGFGIQRSSNLVYLIYAMPVSWIIGLLFFINFLKQKINVSYLVLLAVLVFWLYPLFVFRFF